jgi:hypothetical protein
MKRKTGVCIYEVQVKENYRQSGHKRVWDMVLSILRFLAACSKLMMNNHSYSIGSISGDMLEIFTVPTKEKLSRAVF